MMDKCFCVRCERNVIANEFDMEIERCIKCKGQLERQRIASRKFYEKHKNDEKDRHKIKYKSESYQKYLQENKDKINEQKRNRRKQNPEKHKEYDKRKRENPKYQEWKKEYDKKYHEEHAEKLKEYRKIYYEENKEEITQKNKERYEKNKDKNRVKRKKYYNENFDKIKEKNKIYRESPRGKIVLHISKMKHKKKIQALPYEYNFNDWQHCYEYFEGVCPICDDLLEKDIQMDHWIPVSHPKCPGTIPTNIVVMCGRCNRSKWKTKAEVWLQQNYPDNHQEILDRINIYFKSLTTI